MGERANLSSIYYLSDFIIFQIIIMEMLIGQNLPSTW